MTNKMHEANRIRWDAASSGWARGADSRGLWQRCVSEPELVLSPMELKFLGDARGRRIAVLGSGDNQAAFAMAGLGANVTSIDISQNQLDVAEGRARELGVAMSFVRADVMDLSAIDSETFDIVYTGGHVAVWVSDLDTFYKEAARILLPNGLLIVSEYHPFRRIWKESKDELTANCSYFDRGPFEYSMNDDILMPKSGELKSYEFHWSVSDYINSVLRAGCQIVETDEFGVEVADWEGSPMQGLPEFLLIISRKSVVLERVLAQPGEESAAPA